MRNANNFADAVVAKKSIENVSLTSASDHHIK
jgi:hypothetical protein